MNKLKKKKQERNALNIIKENLRKTFTIRRERKTLKTLVFNEISIKLYGADVCCIYILFVHLPAKKKSSVINENRISSIISHPSRDTIHHICICIRRRSVIHTQNAVNVSSFIQRISISFMLTIFTRSVIRTEKKNLIEYSSWVPFLLKVNYICLLFFQCLKPLFTR